MVNLPQFVNGHPAALEVADSESKGSAGADTPQVSRLLEVFDQRYPPP